MNFFKRNIAYDGILKIITKGDFENNVRIERAVGKVKSIKLDKIDFFVPGSLRLETVDGFCFELENERGVGDISFPVRFSDDFKYERLIDERVKYEYKNSRCNKLSRFWKRGIYTRYSFEILDNQLREFKGFALESISYSDINLIRLIKHPVQQIRIRRNMKDMFKP